MMIAVATFNIIAIIAMIFATRELNRASRAIERVSSLRCSARIAIHGGSETWKDTGQVRHLFLLLARLKAPAPHLLNQPRRLDHAFKADCRSLFVILQVTRKVFSRGIVDTKSTAQEIADRLRLEFAKLTR